MHAAHAICKLLLRDARERLAESPESVKALTGMYVDRCNMFAGKRYFWVRLFNSTVIWEGTDCCVYSARAKAIIKYLEDNHG